MRKRRLHRSTEGQLMITQAANGFIVRLPEDNYLGPVPVYGDNDLDLRKCLTDPKWIYNMFKVIEAAKNGSPLPEEEKPTEKVPQEGLYEFPNGVPNEEENYVHIFATWTEAAAFIEDYYKS